MRTPSRLFQTSQVAACALALCAVLIDAAAAAEIRVLCPSALRAPVLEIARGFARASSHRLEFVFASVGAIHKRVATGEIADVAIGTAQGVDALLRLGRGVEATDKPVVRPLLALAVRKGARVPEIASVDALAQALRAAGSIVQPDPGLGVPGGGQVAELVERLGLTAELKPRTRLVVDVRDVVKRVAGGSAELGIAAMSDLVGAAEVTVVGPIADPATSGVTYAAVVVRGAKEVDAGRAFIAYLAGPEAMKIFRAAGYGPVD